MILTSWKEWKRCGCKTHIHVSFLYGNVGLYIYIIQCMQVNSEICEQTFSWLSCYSKMTRHDRFLLYTSVTSTIDANLNSSDESYIIFIEVFSIRNANIHTYILTYIHIHTHIHVYTLTRGVGRESGDPWIVHVPSELL